MGTVYHIASLRERPSFEMPAPGHRERLQRLVGNLLDNAIKFTPEGGAVSLALDRNAGSVILRVSDTGCGIAPEDIPHVFRRFVRSLTCIYPG